MQPSKSSFSNIDEYIAHFPEETQKLLQEIRATISAAAPEAREVISYNMPAFALHGNLVYFAALKNAIGFYPASSGIDNFKAQIANYKHTPGAINFPYDQPLPVDLITRIVQFRVQEDIETAAEKARKLEAKKSRKKES